MFAASKVPELIKQARTKRSNRCYYFDRFASVDLHKCGIVQTPEKSKFDYVQTERDCNESIRLIGLANDGSNFELHLDIFSLYLDANCEESSWRLATVLLKYSSLSDATSYEYNHQELIDYDLLRNFTNNNEPIKTFKIGFLTYEIVFPFSLSRLLFNGIMQRCNSNRQIDYVSLKLSISSHPTADKFDYKYKFNPKHMETIVCASLAIDNNPQSLINHVLEDRIDQPMMYLGELVILDDPNNRNPSRFVLWGPKIRRYINAERINETKQVESIVVFARCGHLIVLNRPIGLPDLVYGLVSSGYEYTSHLYDASCSLADDQEFNSFAKLDSFALIPEQLEIKLTAYRRKDYVLKFTEAASERNNWIGQVTVNGFDGCYAMRLDDLQASFKLAQSKLYVMNIQDSSEFVDRMASERLLGGKGNSLIELHRLINNLDTSSVHLHECRAIQVPDGFVVTCAAYKLWLSSNPLIGKTINRLDRFRRTLAARSYYVNPLSAEHLSIGEHQKLLKQNCAEAIEILKACTLPLELRNLIEERLKHTFDDYLHTSFAIRSSAVGEDSLDSSAAGQMSTFLQVAGLNDIYNYIVACWSSQFSAEAVTYKTQNGMAFNWPMAVVVQRMVDCHSAGVASTCDPLSGNLKQLDLSASLGLGETVVSGAKTDSIRIDLSVAKLKWNHQLHAHEGHLSLDDKHAIVRLTESCCLTDQQILSLANFLLWIRVQKTLAVKSRELEWGITTTSSNGDPKFTLHLFQSRPLTNLNKLTTFELDHELDGGFATPMEVLTRTNIGEVMPGTTSPLTMYMLNNFASHIFKSKPYEPNHTACNYLAAAMGSISMFNCIIMSCPDFLMSDFVSADQKKTNAPMLGYQGQEDMSAEQFAMFIRERLNPNSTLKPTKAIHYLGYNLLGSDLDDIKNRVDTKVCEFLTDLTPIAKLINDHTNDDHDEQGEEETRHLQIREQIHKLFQRLLTNNLNFVNSWENLFKNSNASSFFNTQIMDLLRLQPAYANLDQVERESQIAADFSVLLAGAGNDSSSHEHATESGQIGGFLDRITQELKPSESELSSMNHIELYELLTSSEPPDLKYANACRMFRDFMDRNGHRGFKEFDLSSLNWRDNPTFVVKSLQSRLKLSDSNKPQLSQTQVAKLNEVVSKVEINSRVLHYYLLPSARKFVVRRERAKSKLVVANDQYRQAIRHLGCLLCLDGRLSSANQLFFMTFEEIATIVTGKSEPEASRILYKSRLRQQRAKVLDRFAPTGSTYEKMLEATSQLEGHDSASGDADDDFSQSSKLVRGLTSCEGKVTGRALVVSSIDEICEQVQMGDILVTNSVDTPWSVYYFALAGIVTELGGLISHGVVVAREYGIPTLCGATQACKMFQTGQTITLDASKGVCYIAEATE